MGQGNRLSDSGARRLMDVTTALFLKFSLKVMVASGDQDEDVLELMGDKLLGHCWRPADNKLVFRVVVSLSTSKKNFQKLEDVTVVDVPTLLLLISGHYQA